MPAASKDDLLRAIDELPPNASIEDAMERLYFMYKVQEGLSDAEKGRTLDHKQVRARIDEQWQR